MKTAQQLLNLKARIEAALRAQYLQCIKANNGLNELPKDKEGNPHRSKTYSMKIHDSLVAPINEVVESLKDTSEYITLNQKNVIGAYPSRETISTRGKNIGMPITLSATIIFAEPTKPLEFVNFETGEVIDGPEAAETEAY